MFIAKCSLIVGSTLAVPDGEWEAWKSQYGRVYNSDDEDAYRRTIFERNLDIAQEKQALNPLAKFGATKFSDWTQAEFKARMLTYKPSNRTLKDADLSHLPSLGVFAERDWTGVATTPIKDQGQCGSCWAFSATEQIESDNILQGGSKVELSAQEVNDCTSAGAGSYRGGCDGGDPADAYEVVMDIGGLTLESNYRYTGRDGRCKVPPPAVQVSDWQWVGRRSESQMQSYVASSGTLSVCVDANDYNYYQGGIMTNCGNDVDHCVQIVGVGQSGGTTYWKVRNSWGSNWGERGMIRIAYGRNLCDITCEPSKVTVSGGVPTPPPTPPPTPSPTPSPPSPPGTVKLLHQGRACADQTINLGNSFGTPEQCAAAAQAEALCSGYFMHSAQFWANWGCRCCTDENPGNYNDNWDMYQYWDNGKSAVVV